MQTPNLSIFPLLRNFCVVFCGSPTLRGGVALLLGGGLGGEAVVLVDVGGLPGVADPDVANGAGGHVAAGGDDIAGEAALLGLVLVLGVC